MTVTEMLAIQMLLIKSCITQSPCVSVLMNGVGFGKFITALFFGLGVANHAI